MSTHHPIAVDTSRDNGHEKPWKPGPRIAGGMRHENHCRHSGQPVGPPGGPDHSIPLSHSMCACDPYGDKARQLKLIREGQDGPVDR